MRALLQRVTQASVTVDTQIVGAITHGYLILLGIGPDDGSPQVKLLVDKIVNLRVFEDVQGKMNLSLLDVKGQALVVSQFTLYADIRKGRRPSFVRAAAPDHAAPLVETFKEAIAAYDVVVAGGVFGADMHVALINNGPVTIWIDSAEL